MNVKPWERQYKRTDDLTPSYPYVQWVNDPGRLVPRQPTGGFAAPIDQDIVLSGIRAKFLHANTNNITEVVFTPEITVAVLGTRSAWVTQEHIRTPEYVAGARKRIQVLCLLRNDDDNGAQGPIMLTFIGLSGSRFQAARYKFVQQVRALTKGKAPSYAFWMKVKAGDIEMVGKTKKSPITNILLAEDLDPDRDFIGNELVDYVDSLQEIDVWVNAWKKPGLNGEGVVGEEVEEVDEVFPEYRDPADPASWYAEGTWEWAMLQTLPFDAKTAKAGTPLNKLGDDALEYIAGQEHRYPTAAKAARVLLRVRREPAPSEFEDIPF